MGKSYVANRRLDLVKYTIHRMFYLSERKATVCVGWTPCQRACVSLETLGLEHRYCEATKVLKEVCSGRLTRQAHPAALSVRLRCSVPGIGCETQRPAGDTRRQAAERRAKGRRDNLRSKIRLIAPSHAPAYTTSRIKHFKYSVSGTVSRIG